MGGADDLRHIPDGTTIGVLKQIQVWATGAVIYMVASTYGTDATEPAMCSPAVARGNDKIGRAS